ncbi:unnamed protein product, partial [Amoebophrya sp. A120]
FTLRLSLYQVIALQMRFYKNTSWREDHGVASSRHLHCSSPDTDEQMWFRLREDTGLIAAVQGILLPRCVLVLCCLLADYFLPDHVPDASVRRYDGAAWHERAFTRWDSAQFLTVAQDGYREEPQLAFFPFFPGVIREIASWTPLTLPWSGVVLNLLLSVVIGIALLKLTIVCRVSASGEQGTRTSIPPAASPGASEPRENSSLDFGAIVRLHEKLWFWVCVNPALVFFVVNYSESSYAAAHFTACWLLEKGSNVNVLLPAIGFFLASATRANGILSLVLIALHPDSNPLCGKWMRFTVLATAAVLPFLLVEGFAAERFDFSHKVPSTSGVLFDEASSTADRWLFLPEFRLQSAYATVQEKYWNNGFLRYWQLRKLPNFFLAGPMLWMVYGYVAPAVAKKLIACFQPQSGEEKSITKRERLLLRMVRDPFLKYELHTILLVTFVFLNAHVETITRLAWASSPILYWLALRPDLQSFF